MIYRTLHKSVIQMAMVVLSVFFINTMGCDSDDKEGENTQDGGGGSSRGDGTDDTDDSDSSTPPMDSSTDTDDDAAATDGIDGSGTMDASTGEDGSNGGTDDTEDSSSSGNGGDGSGGTGGDDETGGTGGSDDTPLTCDGEVCEAPSGSMLTPCCVEDGDDEVCGGRLNDGCLPWAMGGELDSTCPDYEYRAGVVLEGCCTPDDMCGVWSTQGLECIERTDLDEYLGGDELSARECGITDEDAGS